MTANRLPPMPPVDGLPPGPPGGALVHTVALAARQRPYLERARRRYGALFTVRIAGLGPIVMLSDPVLIKQVFTADPTRLHAGTQSPLRHTLGRHSLLGIDEDEHMEQRRLLLPPFKGQRMKAYEGLIAEIAAREIDAWPIGEELPTAPAMQRITLRAILRAVFGASGDHLRRLEELIPPWTDLGGRLTTLTFARRDLGPWSPGGRFRRLRERIDAVLDALIAEAKADPRLAERADVLALLVQATHTDGSPMTNAEIRDQLVTMLAAGHETTSHTLSWAVERLTRHPELLARLVEEVDAGGPSPLRDATIREVQRQRPVIAFSARAVRREPYELGGWRLPVGTRIALAACLTHFDPALFDRPDRFDPDRFLDVRPDTYSWIPFGGGIRRCIGATFAHMEMDVVLRTVLERVELRPTTAPDEPWHFRGVAWSPGHGGRVTVRRRAGVPEPAAASAALATA